MRKVYSIGIREKHRLEFRVDWLFGVVHLACDGKTLIRRPLFSKIERSFEIGNEERHIIKLNFNLFDYFGEFFQITADGQTLSGLMEIQDKEMKKDTPLEDAAAAFLFLAAMNVIFSVIGTLFVPYLDSLQFRFMLLLGGMIYLLFAVKTVQRQPTGILAGTCFFLVDSVYSLVHFFSVGGLVVRLFIFYYLCVGAVYFFRLKRAGREAAP